MQRTTRQLARAILALSLISGDSPGQEAPALSHPLSLNECVRIAVEKNPSAASALHSGSAALANVGISRAAYWPTLGINGSLSQSLLRRQNESSDSTYNGITSSAATFSGQYDLWDSGRRKAALEEARTSYQASDARYATTLQDLALSVESAYFSVQGAEWVLAVAQDTLKQADFHLDMARTRNEVGLAPRSDVLKATTAQADARLGVIQAESLVASTRSNLAILMGFSADTSVQVLPAERDVALPELPDWASGWQQAQTSLPELRAAEQTAESFRFSYLGAKAAYRPTVTASGSAGILGADDWPDQDEWRLGVSLNIPVFTGYENKYRVLQAREAWQSARADVQSTLLTAERNAYEARIALSQALQSVVAANAYVASAQENSDVAEGQYQNGLGSMLDVVDATTSLATAKLRLISARLSVATARAAWERATGKNLLGGIAIPSTSAQLTDGDK
ncbi:MAG: TolC family protein [Acidobacteriota bacterium]